MAQAGIEIASHTRSHPCLDMCSDEVVRTEIRGAWRDLWELLGEKPTSFAYPNGNFDPRARAELASLGTRSAYLFDHKLARLDGDALKLSRLRLDATAGIDRVAAILSGSHSTLMRIRGR